jgi:hypothetical protein
MDLEARVDGEAPVELLLLRTEELRHVRHWNDLWFIDFIWLTMGHDARRPACEDVLRPIGACAIRERYEKAAVVLNRDDRGFVALTRTAPNVTDDRVVGLFGAGRSHSERSCHLRDPAQSSLHGSVHVIDSTWILLGVRTRLVLLFGPGSQVRISDERIRLPFA